MAIISFKEIKVKSNKELIEDFGQTITRQTQEVNSRGRATIESTANFERLEAEIERRMEAKGFIDIIAREYYHHKHKMEMLDRRLNLKMPRANDNLEAIDRFKRDRAIHQTRMVQLRSDLAQLGVDVETYNK